MRGTNAHERIFAELVEALHHYRCVPFVGAGMSKPSGTPSWSDLIEALSRRLQLSKRRGSPLSGFNVLQVPGYYEQIHGLGTARRFIAEQFSSLNLRPNEYHAILRTLPFRTYVTTNWDTLIEDSLREIGIVPNVIRQESEVSTFNDYSSTNVVKLHGCITDLQNIVVAELDYLDYANRHTLLSGLIRHLFITRSMLFLGFSFSDPNVRLIFHEIVRQLKNTNLPSYVVFAGEDRDWAKYCEVLGLRVINLPLKRGSSKKEVLLGFLKEIKDEAQVLTENKTDRADLLVRETKRAIRDSTRKLTLRVRASLGPLASPKPEKGISVFGDERLGQLEWELNRVCRDLIKRGKGHMKCMLSLKSDYLLRKNYSVIEAQARLRELLSAYRDLGDGFEVAEIEEPIELNQFFIDDKVCIESIKTVKGKLYNHAVIIRDRNELRGRVKRFDEYFGELGRLSNDRANDRGLAGKDRARADIEKRLSDELQILVGKQ